MLTALAKLVSAYQTVGYLTLRDPLFESMTNRQVLSGAAAVELVVVVLLIWVKSQPKQLSLIAWLSSLFLLYRVSLYLVSTPGYVPCPCLGNAAEWLHLSPTHLGWLVKAVLVYLLIGSYGLLIGLRLRMNKGVDRPTSSSLNSALVKPRQEI